MARLIEITLETRGVACVAEMLDDRAPRTCAAVWDALPRGGDVWHAKYARNEIYALVPPVSEVSLGLENPTITPIPGDVMYFDFAETALTTSSHGYGATGPDGSHRVVDLAVFYERNNLLLNADVGFVPGTVFASIVEGLEPFAAACQDLWRNGFAGERLGFARVDG